MTSTDPCLLILIAVTLISDEQHLVPHIEHFRVVTRHTPKLVCVIFMNDLGLPEMTLKTYD